MANIPPQVGMGATYYVGSDRYPYTIVEVVNDRTIKVQADHFKRTDKNGLSESQTYEYCPNKNATIATLTLRRNGKWVEKGLPLTRCGFLIGKRNAYQDPSF